MTDPAGGERLHDDVASDSSTGDDGALGASIEDVPLTRNEAVERDAASSDEQPASPDGEPSLIRRADPDGSS
jgi:hypothetical protein